MKTNVKLMGLALCLMCASCNTQQETAKWYQDKLDVVELITVPKDVRCFIVPGWAGSLSCIPKKAFE